MSFLKEIKEERIDTDILVIGGGLAGSFAAIKAKEAGIERVTLVSKGTIGKDSISTFAAGVFTMIFPEDNREDLVKLWGLSEAYGAGIYEEEWLNIWLNENYDRILDMEQYGVTWEKDENGIFKRKKGRFAKMVGMFHGPQMMAAMAAKVKEIGVQVIGNTMITDLLTEKGRPEERVTGAVGFDVRTGDFRVIKARAVILASGGCGLKSRFSCHRFQTGESCTMAYRAGARLGRFETGERLHTTATDFDTHGLILFIALGGRFVNSEGERFMKEYDRELGDFASMSSVSAASAMEVRAGRGPIYLDMTSLTPADIHIMKISIPQVTMILERTGILVGDRIVKKIEWAPALYTTIGTGGGAVTNTRCETDLQGLYACGDAMSRPPHFAALPGASISGARAGMFSAEYLKDAKEPEVYEEQVRRLKDFTFLPLQIEDGVDPEHVILGIHEALLPYGVTVISRGDRIEKAVREVERIRDEEVPQLYATDPHYLRIANETKSIVLVAEMYLRSRLMREESREGCLREDFPYTDNVDWLKWSMLKQENKKIKLWTEDIPVDNYKYKPKREKYLCPIFEAATNRGVQWG
ncbi:MAG: FAD-dependent oxidoreductase [Deltaproteobacteria bacterium]|nr:FAD-dependent oxidoreductase [Deltaproteobacteria bacterium]